MSDEFRIDSHKLTFHPARVAQWLEAQGDWDKEKKVYPIYVEISPYGACNHRCIFCSVDFVGYQTRGLDPDILRARLTEMAGLGIKAVMFAGEGEPLLWKHMPATLDHCAAVGIDTSLTTNMVPLSPRNVDAVVGNCSWIKTSINAGTPATYAAIHRTQAEDFTKVLGNFSLAVERRAKLGSRCTIGGQILLLPENADEVAALALALRERGVDYLVVKPYTQSLYGIARKYEGLTYERYFALGEQLKGLETDTFKVVFRQSAMQHLQQRRRYETCQSTPFFWGYIMADGSVYGCSAFLGNENLTYGNINENTFQDIWESERRRKGLQFIRETLDIGKCRINCRMDKVNEYLWQLLHPDHHVNFI